MGHGGVRPGGGRPKGASNKRTKETIAEAAASGVMPLEFMLAVMRDRNAPTADRFEAAKAAVPYVHGKLVASHTTEGDKKETLLQWIERQPPPLMIEDQSA